MAEDGGSTGDSANSGDQQGGTVQAQLFTQDAVNSIAAREKRAAVGNFFKELGFDSVPDAETVKNTFAAAAEHKKLKDGEKGDVERIGTELAAEREKSAKVPGLETTILQQRIAGEQKLPVKFWKFVEGKTDDEIKESITELKQELGLDGDDDNDDGDGDGQQQGRQERQPEGTGARPPKANQQQGRTSGGGSPTKTLSAGAEAYKAKHGKKE